MDDAQQYTPAQAADPSTPAEVLAAIAGSRPDLHAYLAANPSTYPALLEWLGDLGDPAVEAALRARESTAIVPDGPGERAAPDQEAGERAAPDQEAGPAGGAPTERSAAAGQDEPGGQEPAAYLPPAAAGQPWSEVTRPSTESSSSSPAPSGTAVSPDATSPYAAPTAYPTGGPGVPPGGPAAGTPTGEPVGYPFPTGDAGGGPGTSPYGAPGQSAYGPGDGQPQRGSRTWLWVLLALLGILAVGGTIIGILVVRTISDAANDAGTIFDTGEAGDYGDDPALDALWDACAGGDMAACDDLYLEAPDDSEYQEFADTCGGRTEGGTWCRESDLDGAAAPVLDGHAHERADAARSIG